MCLDSFDKDEYTAVIWTLAIGHALTILYTFVISNFRVCHLIAVNLYPKIDFSVFFKDGENISMAFRVSCVLGSGAAFIMLLIGGTIYVRYKKEAGYYNDKGPLIAGIGLALLLVGWLVMRLIVALLGYILWLLFSPIMIIFFMIAMIVLSIVFITDMSYRKNKIIMTCILISVIFICCLMCSIGFRYMLGDTTEDMVVWVVRLFV